MGAALAEDDVAGHDELGGAFFGTETFPRARCGFVGSTLRGVRGASEVCE